MRISKNKLALEKENRSEYVVVVCEDTNIIVITAAFAIYWLGLDRTCFVLSNNFEFCSTHFVAGYFYGCERNYKKDKEKIKLWMLLSTETSCERFTRKKNVCPNDIIKIVHTTFIALYGC